VTRYITESGEDRVKDAAFWIEHLHLQPHPEGGYFRETYRSTDILRQALLPPRYSSDHACATAIYFLLESGQVSKFHRLRSDELWCYHAGSPLTLYAIAADNTLDTCVLGTHLDNGEAPQILIPQGLWFGAAVVSERSYTLASCLVAPGFEFEDFELATYEQLVRIYPQHQALIDRLT
jgi:predicted cupin superfamily sugar epimerase